MTGEGAAAESVTMNPAEPAVVNRKRRWWVARVLTPLAYGALATLIAAGLQSISTETGLARLERDAYAWHLLHRPSRPPDPSIALVAVDAERYEGGEVALMDPQVGPSLEAKRVNGCRCPAPRICYAQAIDRLKDWGARAIVLDILFRQPCIASLTNPKNIDEDAALAKSIADAGNVLLPADVRPQPVDREGDPARSFDPVQNPIEPLNSAALEIGSPRVDPRDAVYGVELKQTLRDVDAAKGEDPIREYPALGFLAWGLYHSPTRVGYDDPLHWASALTEGPEASLLGDFFRGRSHNHGRKDDVEFRTLGGAVTTDDVRLPKRLLINFSAGEDAGAGRYRATRLSHLLEMSPDEGRKAFGGKLVIIGAPGGDDVHKTLVGVLPGMEVLANAAATMLQERPIRQLPGSWVLLLAFGLAIVTAACFRALPAAGAVFAVAALLGAVQATSATLLSRADLWLMPVTPSVAVILSAAAAGAWESRRVQGLVARLVPARITRVMERAGGFGVEEGTVLLSDIRGYSRFSEHLDPATVMALLNDYFSRMHDILDRHNGHFVKSPGDCLVAWFSEEPRSTHHSERALRAALEIIAHADEFGKRWAAYGTEPFVVGVGVNSGPMAVGVLDARRHIEPTVIGDAVNVAARLEGMTHAESAPILATEETIAPVRDRFDCHFVGELKLGGRARPARIYRVDGLTVKPEERPNARRGAI